MARSKVRSRRPTSRTTTRPASRPTQRRARAPGKDSIDKEVADVRAALRRAAAMPAPGGGAFIDPARPFAAARAPGRLDVVGGVGDYSGSRVLEWPIAQAAVVLVQLTDEARVVVRSVDLRERGVSGADEVVELPLEAVRDLASYPEFRSRMPQGAEARWAAYVLGAFAVLAKEKAARFDRGCRILLDSLVPPGKGLASSAAIEVAALLGVARAYRLERRLPPGEVPALAQKIENEVVGAPCGIMDQITAYRGVAGAVLPIDCRPGSPLPPIQLPEGLEVAGLDSGVRHDVGGEVYRAVRTGAAMGYRIIADVLKLAARPAGLGRVTIDDPLLGGYLANLPTWRFEREILHRLPEKLSGAHFLDCFGGITDFAVSVEPGREYLVRPPTAHPIYENLRAKTFGALLAAAAGPASPREAAAGARRDALEAMGELLLAAHESYSRSGLGDPLTDLLVELCMAEGPAAGIYGAKSSGGGAGGTVVVLFDRRGQTALRRVAAEFAKRTGNAPPLIVRGSSAGAFSARS